MFKLVILIMLHQNSGHVMKVSVDEFSSFEACNAKTVEISETFTGWSNETKPVMHPKQVLSIHCEKEQ